MPSRKPESNRHVELKRRFGATVRHLRHKAGLTQHQLAARAGMHRTYLADVERGARNIAITNADILYRALQVKPSQFHKRMETAIKEPV